MRTMIKMDDDDDGGGGRNYILYDTYTHG